MPIIEEELGSFSELLVETSLTGSIVPEIRLGGTARANTTLVATVSGTLEISGGLDVVTSITGVVNAFIPPSPDILVELDVQTSIVGVVTPQLIINAQLQVSTSLAAEVTPDVSRAELFEEIFIIDRLMPRPTGGRAYGEILTVDGNQIDVKDWSFKKQKQSIRHELAITLADPDDGALITRNSQITFQAGYADHPFTSFNYTTLLSNGYANESTLEIRPPSEGEDAFTFVGLTPTQARLNRTPATNLVLYDPNLVDVDAADFRVIYDEYGRAFETEIVAIPNMTIEDIFTEILVDRCGFAAVEPNFPADKYRISRIDFNAGEAYLSAIAGRIGMYEPALEEIGSTLWIRGTVGVAYPSGEPDPEEILASDSLRPQIVTNHKRIDVIEMIYNLWTYEYDYTSERQENSAYSTDNDGETVITTITRTIQEYYRESQPSRPIHEEPLRIGVTDIRGDGWVMENSTERFYYRGTNRVRRRKTFQVPVPTVTPPYTPVLQHALTEAENYTWKAHPFRPSQIYQQRRNLWKYGLLAVDSSNPRADGSPFVEALIDSHRKANFSSATTISSGPVESEEEITSVINKDAVEMYITQRDHCANVTKKSYTEQRVGDIGKSAIVNEQISMYIFETETAERTVEFKEVINIGELNPLEGKKICRQVLQRRKLFPKSVNDRLFELDLNLTPGSTRLVRDRDGGSYGIYSITSVTWSGGVNGYFTDYSGEQAA